MNSSLNNKTRSSRPLRLQRAYPLTVLCTFFFALALTVNNANADNWPQWRGPGQKSISAETDIGNDWTSENQLWRLPLPGPGGASPVVWDDKIFLTTVDGEGNDGDPVACICVSTSGEVVWSQVIDDSNVNSRDGATAASPSPSTDGENVWAQSSRGVLHCFSMEGALVWKKDLQEAYGEFRIQFGMTSTTIHDAGKLYLQLLHGELKRGSRETSKGWVVCLDAKTGEEIWKQLRETDGTFENMHSYASPVVYRDSEREFLITHGGDFAIGHSLEDGSELWRCGGLNDKDNYNPTLRFVSSPVCDEGMIIVPSAKSGPVLAINPAGEGVITDNEDMRKWRMNSETPDVACPLIYDGVIYLARENGAMLCVDAETGEETFKGRMYTNNHRSSPVAADGKVFVTGRDGKFLILKAGPQPEVLSEIELGEDTTASPAISNGRVYVRTKDALYSFGNK